MKAADYMQTQVMTVMPDTLITEVAVSMASGRVQALVVADALGKILGMITERDLLYKEVEPSKPSSVDLLGGLLIFRGRSYNDELRKAVATTAGELMRTDISIITPDMRVEDVATRLVEEDISHLPVVEDGKLAGVIGQGDLVQALAAMLQE